MELDLFSWRRVAPGAATCPRPCHVFLEPLAGCGGSAAASGAAGGAEGEGPVSLQGPVHRVAGVAEGAAGAAVVGVRRVRRPASLQRELELAGEVAVVDRAWVDQVQSILGMLHAPGALCSRATTGASPGAGRRVAARHDGGRHRGAFEGAGLGHRWGPVVAGTLGSIPWLRC